MDLEKLKALNEVAIAPLHKIIKWLLIVLLASLLGNVVQALNKSSEVNLVADDNMYSDISQVQG